MGAPTLTELVPALILRPSDVRAGIGWQMLVTSPQSRRQCGPVTDQHPGLWCSLHNYGGLSISKKGLMKKKIGEIKNCYARV